MRFLLCNFAAAYIPNNTKHVEDFYRNKYKRKFYNNNNNNIIIILYSSIGILHSSNKTKVCGIVKKNKNSCHNC